MNKAEAQKTIEELLEIKGAHTFYDVHVHPFEVMFDACQYQHSPEYDGLYRSGTSEYRAPEITDLTLQQPLPGPESAANKKLRAMACLLNARRFYSHTGPMVFSDHMKLGGIDRVLLLPVMAENETGDAQLEAMARMFGHSEKFLRGYCVPNDVPDNLVEREMSRVVAEYDVKALKIHPSVTGIDLGSEKGVTRVECLLAAAQNNGLKVIIHGGMSPDCKNSEAICYGIIDNLMKIDWSVIRETVIIAHGGCYGYSFSDAAAEVLPELLKLFERYENLSFDTSSISFDVLCQLLKCCDSKRIFFGSDALYEKQWVSLVKLWNAIKSSQTQCEDIFLRIVSDNPKCLFG